MAVPSYSSPEERDTIRRAQNKRIRARMVYWQLQWHTLFDNEPLFGPDSEFAPAEKIPDDIDSDFRLIFGISQAGPATRQGCFAMLPEGDKMAARFESYMARPADKLPRDKAQALVHDLQAALQNCALNEDIPFGTPKIFDTADEDAAAAFANADRVTYLFERSLLEPHDEDNIASLAALFFLTEPLYASAGNWYELCDWVTGVLGDGQRDTCYEQLYTLWTGGWKVGLTDDGLISAPIR